LQRLAGTATVGVSRRSQIIYTTHSPHFVGLDRIDSIRLCRKREEQAGFPKVSKAVSTTLKRVAERLEDAFAKARGTFTPETLLPRLQAIMTPMVNEGFFGDVVVLVEGEEDKSAIIGMAISRGISFESLGISVIPCGGKTNIDRPALIFQSLGIPTYLVWDNDRGSGEAAESSITQNKALLRISGVNIEDWPSGVFSDHCVFERNLDSVLRGEVGEEFYLASLQEIKGIYNISRNEDAIKSPLVIRDVLNRASSQGRPAHSISSLVDAIIRLRR
jgi:putative ATP-dependent endonuclease of OLD family